MSPRALEPSSPWATADPPCLGLRRSRPTSDRRHSETRQPISAARSCPVSSLQTHDAGFKTASHCASYRGFQMHYGASCSSLLSTLYSVRNTHDRVPTSWIHLPTHSHTFVPYLRTSPYTPAACTTCSSSIGLTPPAPERSDPSSNLPPTLPPPCCHSWASNTHPGSCQVYFYKREEPPPASSHLGLLLSSHPNPSLFLRQPHHYLSSSRFLSFSFLLFPISYLVNKNKHTFIRCYPFV